MNIDSEMFLEEIKCCETDEDIWAFVENIETCSLDLRKNYSEKDKLQIVHNQLFRLAKLLRNILNINDFQEDTNHINNLIQNQKKLEKDIEILLNESSELHLELNLHKSKLISTEKELYESNFQLLKLNGDLNILSQLNLEELNELEVRILKCQKAISQQKSMLIQLFEQKKMENKLCTICMSKQYSMLLKPCGHVCVCEDCVKQINKCPIDRNFIISTEKVFLS